MNPTILRFVGIVFMVAAAVLAVLNLRRVANLGVFFLPGVLIVIGVACLVRARNRRL